jgi:ABC-type branched-subunit amino acid transport system ATPase component
MTAGLAAQGLRVSFGGIKALAGVDLSFPAGRVSALIGPNGAGKSTLVNVLTGFQAPTGGRVLLDGRDVTRTSAQQRVRLGVIRSFQSPRVLPALSVLDNVLLAEPGRPSTSATGALLRRRSTRRDEDAAVGRAYDVLAAFGLLRVAHHRGGEISGGQQRLVELARLSLVRADYLILDEPTAGVAPAMRQVMVDHLRRLHEASGAALVVVEHDMSVVEAVADEVFVMADGALLTHGSMAEVRTDSRVVEAYLGATEVA